MRKLFILVVLLWGSWSFADSTSNFLESLRKSCYVNNNANSCSRLAFYYFFGMGNELKKNYTKAIELYNRSCDLGDTDQCEYLGYLYEEGIGVKKNYTIAREFFKKACYLGSNNGCRLYYNFWKLVK